MPYRPGPSYAMKDVYLKEWIEYLVKMYDIQIIVETGLNDGQSFLEFSKIVPYVLGIDIDMNCIDATENLLQNNNMTNYLLLCGDSPAELRDMDFSDIYQGKILYFLDAHWDDNGDISSPIREEIRAIPKGKGIIVLHDIKVPGKDFGYDRFNLDGEMEDFSYELIKDALTEWSPTHHIVYNIEAHEDCYRGVGVVFP